MALTAAEIESATPDEWTGKTTSVVYESTSDVSTWLTRRGYTAFAAAASADQEAALIIATELAEDALRPKVRGYPVTVNQGLLYPAQGAYDQQGRLLLEDEAPAKYLEGIRLLAEHAAAGTLLPGADTAGIRSVDVDGVGIEFVETHDTAQAIAKAHPRAWRKLIMAIPRLVALAGVVLSLLLPARVEAQPSSGGIAAKAFPRQVTVAELATLTADGTNGMRIVTNAPAADSCGPGTGSFVVTCLDTGAAWVVVPDLDQSGGQWRPPVANFASLPGSGNTAGDCRVTLDTALVYCWDGGTWQAGGGGSGDILAVGDCATGSCFQSETARHVLAAPAGGGQASFRALVEADVSDLAHTADDQDATEVPYTPTTGTDWVDPDPADAAEGLDDLATRLTVEEAKPDDDVPESGDFGAAVDLNADGSLSDDVVAPAEMADADHGDISWSLGVATVEDLQCTDCIGDTEVSTNAGTSLAADLEEEAHAAEHENGGADEISVAGLSGELADAQPVTVRKNTGVDVGTRSRLNLIEGSNVTLTVTDDAGSDEVDVTIASAAGASLTVEEADGAPSVSSVATIQFDQADGFTVTDETGGQVQVDQTLAGDVDGSPGANDLDEAAVEAELESVLDLEDLQGAVTDGQIPAAIARDTETCSGGACAVGTDDTVTLVDAASPTVDGRITWDSTAERLKVGDDGVATLELYPGAHSTAADITLAGDVDGTGNSNDLDELAVEAELEGVIDLEDLQGAVTDGQVPDTITLALESATLTSILDDEILIGSGAGTAAFGAIPDCTDAGGGSLNYDASTNTIACGADAGAGGGMTSWDLRGDDGGTASAVTDAEVVDILGGLGLTTDDNDNAADADLTVLLDYGETLAGNPALGAEECVWSTDGTGGGAVLCEGSVADGFEGLFVYPDVTGADDTQVVVTDSTALAGDVTGTTGATVVGDDTHNHGDTTIDGLDASAVTTGAFADARIDGSLEADEVNPTLGTQTQGNYMVDVTLGAGIGGSHTPAEGSTATIATASQEAGFVADGGVTSLTCGGGNQGKVQVLDDGSVEYCDGATTSVLRAGYLDADGVDDTGTDTLDDLSDDLITALSGVTTVTDGSYCQGGAGSSMDCDVATIPEADIDATIARDSELHSQTHALDGADHTLTGATDGQVLQATGATTFAIGWVEPRTHATDCTAITDGVADEVCWELDDERWYICTPSAGACDTAGEWFSLTVDGGDVTTGTVADARIDAALHRDSETKDGDLVSFDDANGDFAATDVDSAIEELVTTNASGPNAADGKVNWEQLVNVPAGFADGTDDGAGGGGDSVEVEDGDDGGTFTAIDTTARLDDSGDINFTFTDGGAGGPDTITATVRADSVALTTDTTGNYVLDVADGTGIDGTASGEGATYTPTLDLTEINSTTFGDNTVATLTHTVDPTGATNPVWSYSDGVANLSTGTLQAGGVAVLTSEVNDLTAAVTWANVPDANVNGANERDEVCGTTDLSSTCEINADVINFPDVFQANTLAGNPAFLVDECFFVATATGGGFICEGSTADTNEQLYLFPDVNGADTTVRIVGDTSSQTLSNKTLTTPTIASFTNATHNHSNAAGGGQFPITNHSSSTSANLRTVLSDESGTGAAVFANGDIAAGTATTPAADDNDTSVATTAYVQGEINGAGGTSLTCASGVCNVDDDFVSNAGDAIAGNLDFNDGTGDSPGAVWTPQTGAAYTVLAEDATDDLRVTTSTTGTENVEFENTGTGLMDVYVETTDGVLTSVQDAAVLTTGTVDAGRVGADHIDATTELSGSLCGTNEILEDQGAAWACIATPAGGSFSFDLTDTDASPILTVDNTEQVQFIGAGTVTVTAAADASNHDVTITGSAHSTECSTAGCALDATTTATTATADDNDTSVATTAFVQQEINGAGGTDLTCSGGQCNVDGGVSRDAESVAAGDVSGSLSGGYTIDADVVDFDNVVQGNTLAGNPALLVDECFLVATATGGGLICEGSTADTNEMLFLVPDLNEADTTHRLVTESATQTLTNKSISGDQIDSGTVPAARVGAGHIDATTELAGGLCGTNEILEDQGAAWACIATPSGGGSGDAIEIEDGDNLGTFTAIDTTARFDDSGDLNFTFADGGAGGPDTVTATVRDDRLTPDMVLQNNAADPAYNGTDVWFDRTGTASNIVFEGATADAFEIRLRAAEPTGSDKVITLPNLSGTVVTTGDSGTVTPVMQSTSGRERIKCINVDPNNSITNWLFFRTERDITVQGIDCIVDAATSVVMTLNECDANGGTCTAIEAAMTCGTTNTTESGGIDNSGVNAGDWIRVTRGTVSGSPTQVNMCFRFIVNT